MHELLACLCEIIFGWLEFQAHARYVHTEPSLVNPKRFQTLFGNETGKSPDERQVSGLVLQFSGQGHG
jgi:hypothetical protein